MRLLKTLPVGAILSVMAAGGGLSVPAQLAAISVAEAQHPRCPNTYAARYRRTYTRVRCYCHWSLLRGRVWGTGTYTDDSSLCNAARHAGVIGGRGGWIVARGARGLRRYHGSSRNGVNSANWRAWHWSVVFHRGTGGRPPQRVYLYQLIGGEYDRYQWRFIWTHTNGTAYRAYWTHARHGRVNGYVYISWRGNQITVRRTRAGGGGVGCNYVGRVRGQYVQGRYACTTGYRGPWRARIVTRRR
jgi:hypothetical protein